MILEELFDVDTLTDPQRAIIASALDAVVGFDWRLLIPGLEESTGGRRTIPINFADLARVPAGLVVEGTGGQAHSHADAHEFHVVEFRGRPLGLAWYSGRVDIEATLVSDPALAVEVFLAEAAHMIDFFYMTAAMRHDLFDVFHGGNELPGQTDTSEHGHGWFEETGSTDYWSWVGEAWMGGFIVAYTELAPTLTAFTHRVTEPQAEEVRALLRPVLHSSGPRSRVVHDTHRGTHRPRSRYFATIKQAEAEGYRLCLTCCPAS